MHRLNTLLLLLLTATPTVAQDAYLETRQGSDNKAQRWTLIRHDNCVEFVNERLSAERGTKMVLDYKSKGDNSAYLDAHQNGGSNYAQQWRRLKRGGVFLIENVRATKEHGKSMVLTNTKDRKVVVTPRDGVDGNSRQRWRIKRSGKVYYLENVYLTSDLSGSMVLDYK